MRTDHLEGLNEWAKKVAEKATVTETYLMLEGAFSNSFPLKKYSFPDGREYFEAVQDSPWSSGPHFFIALKDKKGRWIPRSLWSRKIMNAV